MAFKYKGLRLKDPTLMKRLRRITGITFSRTSVAYDYYGNSVPANTPRFGFGGIDGVLIEEPHSNLMPAIESQSLSAPYTTGSLNGTYTFMIQGTGSITLSGGATGTVTNSTPVTATVSDATVTLTPTGTATLTQILKTAYPLSWTLGGTTQAPERLDAPVNIINTQNATIELEITPLPGFKKLGDSALYFFGQSGIYNYQLLKKSSSGNITQTTHTDGGDTGPGTPDTTLVNTRCQFSHTWKPTTMITYKDGNPIITTSNPYLLTVNPSYFTIGNILGGSQCNSVIKNFAVTKTERVAEDVARRSGQDGFMVDKYITFVMPLKNDLRAYRVVTV
jgi:hypothetical protein